MRAIFKADKRYDTRVTTAAELNGLDTELAEAERELAARMQVRGLGPAGHVVLYRSEDGRTQLEVPPSKEDALLSQTQIAALYAKEPISEHIEHIEHIFEDGDLDREEGIRSFRTTALSLGRIALDVRPWRMCGAVEKVDWRG